MDVGFIKPNAASLNGTLVMPRNASVVKKNDLPMEVMFGGGSANVGIRAMSSRMDLILTCMLQILLFPGVFYGVQIVTLAAQPVFMESQDPYSTLILHCRQRLQIGQRLIVDAKVAYDLDRLPGLASNRPEQLTAARIVV